MIQTPATPTTEEAPTGANRWTRSLQTAAVAAGGPALAAGAATLGLGLLVVTWVLLPDPVDAVPGWEADIFTAVNGWPDGLQWPLWPVMQLGTAGMYIVGGAGVYALTRRARPALAAAASVLLAWTAARLVKETIERGRPDDLLAGVDERGTDHPGFGYVSGHATVAFALATVLTVVVPGRWRWVPLPVAAVVGLARLYFGAHLPLDVVGGAGLGIVCGIVALALFGALRERAEV
jgi:membrane-associated phospholipid phosphatase